jgi:hypothetical protein
LNMIIAKKLCLLMPLLLLIACGGGSNTAGGGGVSSGGGSTGLTLNGVAATGAAISGGSVDVKCKTGTGSAITNTDGTYTVTISGGVGPCILKAVDPITNVTLYSFVENNSTTANINPVTQMVVANVLTDDPANAFNSFTDSVTSKITSTNIATGLVNVRAATATLGADGDMSGIDFMKGSMTAATGTTAGDSTDKKIDALMAALAAADKKITDLTNQLKTVTSASDATTKMNTLVGNAKYSLPNCPYARSGDVWVLNMVGLAPKGFNVNFNDPTNMVLTNLSDNSTSAINAKLDSSSKSIPCAFTSTVNGGLVEYRISEGGIGVWVQPTSNDFGLVVPQQKTNLLTDKSFVGSYPSMAFVQEKSIGFRAALPMNFVVGSNGEMKAYECDLTKVVPDCMTEITDTNPDTTICTPISNGTLDCSSADGMSATAILFTSGSQTTMFMAITNMDVDNYHFGGLMVMTKAATMKLPTVGEEKAAGSAWFAGINPNSSTVISGETSQQKVETVSPSTNSYTTSSIGDSVIYSRYINTPAAGFGYAKTTSGIKAVGIGSPTGWSLAVVEAPPGIVYDGWFAYVRAKR